MPSDPQTAKPGRIEVPCDRCGERPKMGPAFRVCEHCWRLAARYAVEVVNEEPES